MFRFPTPPHTLVTLQIECVSCKETFTLAEDIANKPASGARRLPEQQSVYTTSQHLPLRDKNLVYPLPRAVPETTRRTQAENSQDKNEYESVNCPRCGTDNRNWIKFAYTKPGNNPWQQLKNGEQKFRLGWLGYLVTALLLLKLVWREWDSGQTNAYYFVFIMLILAGILPIISITSQWRTIRENSIENTYNHSRGSLQKMSPGILTGAAYLLIFVVIIPLFVYIFLPQILGYFKTDDNFITPIDEVLVAADTENLQKFQAKNANAFIPFNLALANIQKTLGENLFLCQADILNSMILNLQNLKIENPTPETIAMADNVLYSLNQLQIQANAGDCVPMQVADAFYTTQTFVPSRLNGSAIAELEATLQGTRLLIQEDPALYAEVSQDIHTIKKIIDKANGGQTVPGTAVLLTTWLKYVGLACLVSVITAVVTTNSYIHQINPHLPRPLCHNVRNLAHVAIWEARHSLEVNGNFHRIEWAEATHNQNGGISLTGRLYPPCRKNAAEKIRGLSYTICTDMWGRILTASAKAAILPSSPNQEWETHAEKQKETSLNWQLIPQPQER